MPNHRGDRWDHREHLKLDSNRHGTRSAQHPQVVRQIEEAEDQEEDWMDDECPNPEGRCPCDDLMERIFGPA